MNETGFKPDAYCGLYCAACPSYIATREGNWKELGLDQCKGCKSDLVGSQWCQSCPFKKCNQDQGIDFCYQCAEYPCQELKNFKNDANLPYHGEVFDHIKQIKAVGKTVWLDVMKKHWSCSACNTGHDWWTVECKKCGTKLNGFIKPKK